MAGVTAGATAAFGARATGGPAYRLVRRPSDGPPPLADGRPVAAARRPGTPTGRCWCVGGPGTGKTTTLVEAVAARVAEGVDPERILVLTFGRRARTALRHRIEARIAGPGGGRVVHEPLVRTFHAYAFGLLRRAAAERGEPSPRLLTGPEQDLVIRELLAGGRRRGRPGRLARRAAAGAAHPGLRRAAARPAAARRRAGHRARPSWPSWASGWAAPTGRPRRASCGEYAAVLALRDATTRGSVAYDHAELVRAAAGAAAPTTPSCWRPSGAGWRTSTSTSWPTPTRPSSTCSPWWPAAASRWSRSPTRTRRRSPSAAPTPAGVDGFPAPVPHGHRRGRAAP